MYSVSDESKYLLILGVPKLDISKELHATCAAFGEITALSVLDDYPSEQFTKTHLLKYSNINSARFVHGLVNATSCLSWLGEF